MKYFALLILLFFYSCSTTSKYEKVKERDRIKKIDDFFKKIDERRKQIKSIQLEAKADSFNKGKRVRGKLMLSLKRPDKLRIDTLSPFEQPVSTMLVKNNELYFYNFEENRLYHGKASEKNLSLFLPVRMNLESFIDMVSGIFPLIAYKKHKFGYLEDTGEYELVLENDEIKEIVKYRAKDLQITKVEIFVNNIKKISVKFSLFKKSDSITYAKKIYFLDLEAESKLKLIITDINYNGGTDDDIYNPISGNYKIRELDDF